MFGWSKRKKTKREIIVNSESLETRVAVLEDGQLEEFQVEHPTQERIVGSIYKGKIQNLEHDLQAAFVDIGMKKNAFLHYWDMIPDNSSLLDAEDGHRRRRSSGRRSLSNREIEKRFPPGSEIIVQVTKGSIGTKGPRVTASISIPGRYLVMMPGSRMKGVSRKIADIKERQRLKKILLRMPLPGNMGLIIRTVAEGTGKRSFIRDLRGLTMIWEDLQKAIIGQKAPSCVYQEPDLVQRVVRDWLTEDIDRIVVDSCDKFDEIKDLAAKISRRARSHVHLYEGDLPVFSYYEVEGQLEKALRRKVMLKSGGYIVFDETEALVAIDVNTGRHKGTGSQEDAILKVNTEAIEEVARQLRLRNIGGLVVIDLIDMKSRKHQNAVYRIMKSALRKERAKTNVLPISELGIMEMTRQRVEESVFSFMYIDCPYCRGRGSVKSLLGMSVDIQRHISAVMRQRIKSKGSNDLQIVVHPTVLDRLRKEDEKFLLDLETKFEGRLSFKSDHNIHVEHFSINDHLSGETLYTNVDN